MVFFGGSFHFLSAVVVSDVTVPHDLFSESVSSFQVSSENMVKYGRRKIARVEIKIGNFGKKLSKYRKYLLAITVEMESHFSF